MQWHSHDFLAFHMFEHIYIILLFDMAINIKNKNNSINKNEFTYS
jgi:hypothetical protein